MIDHSGEAQIDNGVIRALLKVPKYNHKLLCESIRESESMVGDFWGELSEDMKNNIRNQVRSIPRALNKISYELISVKEEPEAIRFTDKELNILAEQEHKRNSLMKKEAGWKYGNDFHREKKLTHP